MTTPSPRVVQYQRRSRAFANYSVEQSFGLVREALRGSMDVALAVAPLESRGIADRVAIARDAAAVGRTADVLHILGDITFAGAATDPARTIVTVLDCVHETWDSALRRAVVKFVWLTLPARRGVHFAAISRFTAERLAAHAGVDARTIAVIPPAVDPRFAAAWSPMPTDAPMALIVGTTPNKNVDRALTALGGLGVRACVIGPLDEHARRAAREARIELEQHDRVTDGELLALYARAHVVLFPSLYEGFGLPVAEAQGLGRPVVTSDREPMRDTAGGAAWFVDPLDPRAIAAGVRAALTSGPERDARLVAARANAARFTPAVVAPQWEALYRRVADAAGPRASANR